MGPTSFPKLVGLLWFLSVAIGSQAIASAIIWYPAKVGSSHLLGSILEIPVANELSCAMKATKMSNFNLWCYENQKCTLYDQKVLPFTDHSGIDTLVVHCMTSIPIGSSLVSSYSSSSIPTSISNTDTTPSALGSPTSTSVSTTDSLTTLTTATLPETASTTTLVTTFVSDTTTTESTASTTSDINTTIQSDTSPTTTTTTTTPTSVPSTTTSTVPTTTGEILNLCIQVQNVGCIHLVETSSTWDEAKAGCQSLGGHLYNADTEQQFLDLVSYINLRIYPRYIWLGVKSRTWELSSRPVSDNEWHITEPNGNADYCGYLNKEMDYYLADFVCSDPSPYLCQS
ncbi:uncharacterized protein [Palaemon carinicauda]|uniref:uncharacterized protein n=1 Tax=Palaemon carinicauda TaxID=392227 RepID=UPI0035B67F4D